MLRRLLNWLRYQWHLGDCSAGGPPCGYDCLICFRHRIDNLTQEDYAKIAHWLESPEEP